MTEKLVDWRRENRTLDSLISATIEEVGDRTITLKQFKLDMEVNLAASQNLVNAGELTPTTYMKYKQLYYQVLTFYEKRGKKEQ